MLDLTDYILPIM